MEKHITFYQRMAEQGFLPAGLARKVTRAEEIIETNTPLCEEEGGCSRGEQKALNRAKRIMEKSVNKSERFEAKLEKRVCGTDVKWHKVEDRIHKLADECRVSVPAYELHPEIPNTLECAHHI